MVKNTLKNNTLFKRKNLLEIAKKNKIKLSKDSIKEIEFSVSKYLEKVFKLSKENSVINGRKILKKQDIEDAVKVINNINKKIGRVKTIQHEKKNLPNAEKGKEVAVSVPGVNFERELEVGQKLYSNLSESQFRKFKDNKDLLGVDEKRVLMEIAEIKRKASDTWGI